jgi:hypothetical protein
VRLPRPWNLPTQPATFGMLTAAGVTEAMIRSQLGAGGLLRLRRGIYLAASAWPTDRAAQHVLLARAESLANPGGVISHESAAVVWGLPAPGFADWADAPATITLPAGSGHTFHASHHIATLPAEQIAQDAGYAVTGLARTAVDLAAGRELPAALVILDAAARKLCEGYLVTARRSDFSNPRLVAACRDDLLKVAATRPGPDLTQPIGLADPARESVAESLSAGHFELAGLPRPECQARLVTPRGTFYPDFWWPDANLVGECDGAVKYGRADAYVNEKEREQALRDAGFRMVRWLAKEIMTRPDVVVARVVRKLTE